ncbi:MULTISPECIES: acetyl-CoA carboxylase biotin carboxylase subunit [unclassified Methylophaga]|jgi:pyruvate carboxylase subunit A|uniref:acetyl-CoA carboxylase biotin carboxylase subunit n=1 Tax=unclassified Methylophaga TaxID=2629249 RepID=UPI000C4085C6|nr:MULTISPECIES: acetyl-CoA carboxylase biotin carboxylase subunit [unclassified Methylophaga]MAL48872.1 acetyl-CoA carboxylase biotin carboxylase subunit [Methylophaga sp.]MAP27349.1 acetyl-CoA carboxylase biotin carboxylase subunit [Methylophaga sp.]MBP26194.1 acetyl-CoA carboxylase biotin carboxylase subunit [Methylophaga sp.]|tara:strand:- start:1226 stop:2641 length:1416 start_codon:yes stop_codon:yes gene_type:complete
MLKKILIANRGEIAVRIVRACSEMGIRSVAIYTEPDRYALHVKRADESYSLGDDPLEGYLDPVRLVNLAVETGCDAIHPGYGFLSENARFARLCEQNGIIFIGPKASVIEKMGDKTAARDSMRKAGVPITPGSDGNLENIEEALTVADEIGYPIMIKATSGGGGRGIRRCDTPAELKQQFPRVISEATKAFGSAEVFMEKCIVNPRHIEVQVLADSHGNVVHLYERDCSIQRRNQKLIEIAPSPQLTPEQRNYIGGLAVKATEAVGYENAGTVEFLLTGNQVYFMEMNTRIQVEHTITEQITGIDIVREQLRIAAGETLRYRQEDIHYRGFALQFRINAEDPKNDFLPSFGRITHYYAPGGPGVRVDTAIYTGYEIPPYFDSMCLKLVVWALDWEDAVDRGRRALDDMRLHGIKTTASYYQQILKHPDFRAGKFDTSFVAAHPELLTYSDKRHPTALALVLATAIAAHAGW